MIITDLSSLESQRLFFSVEDGGKRSVILLGYEILLR